MKRHYTALLNLFIFLAASLSFYIFSRFTVDDAFISWRYGKNLIDFGIWNYNPSNFEFVQAYTNPLFALLSIAPNFMAMDIVLFFKILSTITMIAFVAWGLWQSMPLWMILLILAMPATQIHLYSGLETFTYCFLLAWTFICLQEQKEKLAICLTILLCLIRPESWMLCAISPLALSIKKESINNLKLKSSLQEFFSCINFRKMLYCGVPIFLALALYLFIEYRNFGDIIPNTFRIKSGHDRQIDKSLALLLLLLLFSLAPFARKEFTVLFCAVILYTLPVIYVYSKSDLQMNYSARFVFHVAMVLIIIIAKYSSMDTKKSLKHTTSHRKFLQVHGKKMAMALMITVLLHVSSKDAMGLINYYPRALKSHSELGKVIAKSKDSYKINSFSFGDAGMAAYHSGIFSIDNVGLANKAIGMGEFSQNYLDFVSPDIVLLYGNQHGAYSDMSNQSTLLEWIDRKNYTHQCSIYWRQDYLIHVYAKERMQNINAVCESSRQINNIDEVAFMKTHISSPPWRLWRE